MSGLNLTCAGSGSQLAAAHMKWVEDLRLLPSEQGLLWRTLPQITPKLTAWEGSEWTWVLSHSSLSLLWTGNEFTGANLDTQQWKLYKGENTPPSLVPSSSSPPSVRTGTGVMGTALETCTCGARDGALPFARQLTEILQEPRAGHSSPTALGPICRGTSTWRPQIPLSQGRKKPAAWCKEGKNLVGTSVTALQGGCGLQAEGRKEEREAQEMEQPTLRGLKQKGWWSGEEPACLPEQGWAVSSLLLGCYRVLSWVVSRTGLNKAKFKKTLNRYQR